MSRQHDRELYNRQSLRRHDHDYFGSGIYFITARTQDRAPLFGHIGDGGVALNDAGRMIANEWRALIDRFDSVGADIFIVMPDHFHGVVVIHRHERGLAGIEEPKVGLGRVIQAFKSITTRRYIDGVRTAGWKEFNGKVWQRNYYDRIVRDQRELNSIRSYIAANPTKPIEDGVDFNDLQ